MWWHTCRNQISSFGQNVRVNLNRRGASVQSTTDSQGVCISGSNAGYTMFWGSVKGTGYRLHSPFSPSLLLPCVTVYHQISTELYQGRLHLKCDDTRRNPISSFGQNVRVHLNRRGRQFSRLLTDKVCASAVVMLDTPCSEVVWRVLAAHCIRHFHLHFPSRASPCAITFQLDSTSKYYLSTGRNIWSCKTSDFFFVEEVCVSV